jgi:hypothetical protein
MDPESAVTGLAATANERLSALAIGVPAMPVDNYYCVGYGRQCGVVDDILTTL